jgi:uncharacterized membrane protein
MTLINVLTGVFIIFLGILIKHGKLYNLIAGYNTMPKEKKKNIDIKGYSTLFRNCFVLMGLIIIVGNYFLVWLKLETLNLYIITVSVVGVLPFLFVMGKKYDHNKKDKK